MTQTKLKVFVETQKHDRISITKFPFFTVSNGKLGSKKYVVEE
jgi:hypothetical protein